MKSTELKGQPQEKKPNKTTLIPLKQAAVQLGISIWTLYTYTSQGRVPSYRIGRRRFMSSADIENIIEKSRQEATAPAELRID